MSNLRDVPDALCQTGQVCAAQVTELEDGGAVAVRIAGAAPDQDRLVACEVLWTASACPVYAVGDRVLVWLGHGSPAQAVLLGRVGPYAEAEQVVVPAEEFASRPPTLTLEAQRDIVLRNGHARIRLGADGDIEILCRSFTTRSHKLLRLFAPFIHLN